MVERMDTLEQEERIEEAATNIFREVLGHRPDYVRGLGEMVIPEYSRRQQDLAREKEYLVAIEKYKNVTESSNREMEAMKAKITALQEKQEATNRMLREKQEATKHMLREILAAHPTVTASHQETQ